MGDGEGTTSIIRFTQAVAIYVAVLVLCVMVHEGAHALAAVLLGARVAAIGVVPGFLFTPEIERVPWDGQIAWVRVTGLHGATSVGVVSLSGSLATAVAAYLSLLALTLRRPSGLGALFLFTSAVVFGSELFYGVLIPRLGLRQWIGLSDRGSEALQGADMLGVEQPVFLGLLLIHAAILSSWFVCLLLPFLASVRERRPTRRCSRGVR